MLSWGDMSWKHMIPDLMMTVVPVMAGYGPWIPISTGLPDIGYLSPGPQRLWQRPG